MKIAVLGSGGIGGFLGGALARSGEDVFFLARGKHLEAMQTEGLKVGSIALGEFELKVNATDTPSSIGNVDLVLFCVKSYDTVTALAQINPLIGEDTALLSFQNGVDNEDVIAEGVGRNRVLAGVISVESYISEPGRIAQTMGPVKMAMGEMTGEVTARAKRIHEAFTSAGLKCDLSTHIQEDLWGKFLFICATGGVCSLARASIGEVLGFQPMRAFYVAAMKEVEVVARAKGINLDADIVSRILTQADRMNKSTKPSMLRDLERGGRVEVDALNGAVSRFGEQFSVPTPVNDLIYASLKLQDLKASSMP